MKYHNSHHNNNNNNNNLNSAGWILASSVALPLFVLISCLTLLLHFPNTNTRQAFCHTTQPPRFWSLGLPGCSRQDSLSIAASTIPETYFSQPILAKFIITNVSGSIQKIAQFVILSHPSGAFPLHLAVYLS